MNILRKCDLLTGCEAKPPHYYCMYDNMQEHNRLVVNVECRPDLLYHLSWHLRLDVCYQWLLKYLLKLKVDSYSHSTYITKVWFYHQGRQLKIDARSIKEITRVGFRKKIKEGPSVYGSFELFKLRQTDRGRPEFPRSTLEISAAGQKIAVQSWDRALRLLTLPDADIVNLSSLRGALIAEETAVTIKNLYEILPLEKTDQEIALAHKIHKDRLATWTTQQDKLREWNNGEAKSDNKPPDPGPKPTNNAVNW